MLTLIRSTIFESPISQAQPRKVGLFLYPQLELDFRKRINGNQYYQPPKHPHPFSFRFYGIAQILIIFLHLCDHLILLIDQPP